MNDFLTRLVQRTLAPAPEVRPRLAARYETTPWLPGYGEGPDLERRGVRDAGPLPSGDLTPSAAEPPALLRASAARSETMPPDLAGVAPRGRDEVSPQDKDGARSNAQTERPVGRGDFFPPQNPHARIPEPNDGLPASSREPSRTTTLTSHRMPDTDDHAAVPRSLASGVPSPQEIRPAARGTDPTPRASPSPAAPPRVAQTSILAAGKEPGATREIRTTAPPTEEPRRPLGDAGTRPPPRTFSPTLRPAQSPPEKTPAGRSLLARMDAPQGTAAVNPPSVQVTIGRVEVSASAPQPATNLQPRVSPPRLSLAEYLKRRPGGDR